jgi:hypothetical protein
VHRCPYAPAATAFQAVRQGTQARSSPSLCPAPHPCVLPLMLACSQVLGSLAPPPPHIHSAPNAAVDGKPRSAAAAAASNAQSDVASSVASPVIGVVASSWELDLLLQHFMRVSK